jgi:hypothetical protein
MLVQPTTDKPRESTPERDGASTGSLRPAGRFLAHLAEMCVVMCAGAAALSIAVFGGATLIWSIDLTQRFPELSALLIAVNLSLPMLAWMRYRGMAWRPTLEMSGATMIVGLLIIVAYWLDIVAKNGLIELQTSLACPVMLAVMLVRFPLYAGTMAHHAQTAGH